jgi:hypothetical protein
MTAESGNPVTGRANQYQEEIITHWNGRSREYDSRPHHGLQSQREKEAWLETLTNPSFSKTSQLIVSHIGVARPNPA